MNTLLPYPDFAMSASCLDRNRLRVQCKDVIAIMDALHLVNESQPVSNPAIEMWRGYEPQLCEYGLIVCEELSDRSLSTKDKAKIEQHLDWATSGDFTMEKPPWFGEEGFHFSHQSNLVRMSPSHYRRFFPSIPNNLPFVWPVSA